VSVKKNLVKATSATTGTGTLTLSPMTGWAAFSDAYANGDVVPYAIENGDNKEVGLGTVGAGSTLARTTVLATLVGGVYDDTSPAAINLSGNSTVFSGPLAELFTAGEIAGLGTAALKNTGTSGDTVPLCGSNPTIGNQTLTVGSDTNANIRLGITGGAGFLRTISFYTLGVFRFSAGLNGEAESGSDSGSTFAITRNADDGSYIGNGLSIRRSDGAVLIGAASGGYKGAGTINAVGVYDDNVLLTCYAIEAYKQGSVDIAYWDAKVLDLDIPAQPEQVETRQVTRKVQRVQRTRDGARLVQRMVEVDEPVYDLLPVVDDAGQPVLDAAGKPLVESVPRTEQVVVTPGRPARTDVRTHGPAARFAARADELLDPAQYAASWKATGHLPAMPSPAEWEAADKKMSLGDIQQRLWETVEVQAIHIEKLREQIVALEARLTAAGL
jgi:hypothetical protein